MSSAPPEHHHGPTQSDVLVVGGGFAGSVLTATLTAGGYRTHTFDRAEQYPDAFRSEKLEPDQSQLLRRFALLDKVSPPDSRLTSVDTYEHGRVHTRRYDGHYGIRYDDTVNSLRSIARQPSRWTNARVDHISSDADGVTARTAEGAEHRGRLCVIASGRPSLLADCGVEVESDPDLTSLTFGFDVEADSDRPLRAFNYNSEAPWRDQTHYATLFPIGDAWRFNVFTSWSLDEERTRRFAQHPVEMMKSLFPRLQNYTGTFRAITRVQMGRTKWHRVQGPSPDGVLVLGEAYQSVSPATGMGLSKCLTDVHVLLRHMRLWRDFKRVPGAAINEYYQDPEKLACDDRASDGWRWFYDCAHGRSLKSRLRRSRLINAATRVAMMGRGGVRSTP